MIHLAYTLVCGSASLFKLYYLGVDRDIISIADTGSDETHTFWIPLLFRTNGIRLIITPLKILGEQNILQLGSKTSALSLQGRQADHKDYMVRVCSPLTPYFHSFA